jgi:hypothetical protein
MFHLSCLFPNPNFFSFSTRVVDLKRKLDDGDIFLVLCLGSITGTRQRKRQKFSDDGLTNGEKNCQGTPSFGWQMSYWDVLLRGLKLRHTTLTSCCKRHFYRFWTFNERWACSLCKRFFQNWKKATTQIIKESQVTDLVFPSWVY